MTSASTKRRIKRTPGYMAERPPWNQAAEKEIQRLRAAMVHAMDDCETAILDGGVRGRALTYVKAARSWLKSALEKK